MAEQEYYTIITNVGKQLLNDAMMNKEAIELTHIAVGDGGGDLYEPDPSQMALINEKWRGEIMGKETDGEYQSVLDTIITTEIGGFTVRELGVFDSKGRLIYLGKLPEVDKITNKSGAVLDLRLKVYIKYENAASVTIIVADTNEERLKDEILKQVKVMLEKVNITIFECTHEDIQKVVGRSWEYPFDPGTPGGNCNCPEFVEIQNEQIDTMF